MLQKLTVDRVLIALLFHLVAMLFSAINGRACSDVRKTARRMLRDGAVDMIPAFVDTPTETRAAMSDAADVLGLFCLSCPSRKSCEAPLR